jgi:hypothetical protein
MARDAFDLIYERKAVHAQLVQAVDTVERLRREAGELDGSLRGVLAEHGALVCGATVYRLDRPSQRIEEIPIKPATGAAFLASDPSDDADDPNPNTTAAAIPEAAGAVS